MKTRKENWLTENESGCCLNIIVQTNSNKNEFIEIFDNCLKLRITPPPIEGKANQMIVKFVAKFFGVRKNNVKIILGEQNKRKTIRIDGLCKNDIFKHLKDLV